MRVRARVCEREREREREREMGYLPHTRRVSAIKILRRVYASANNAAS